MELSFEFVGGRPIDSQKELWCFKTSQGLSVFSPTDNKNYVTYIEKDGCLYKTIFFKKKICKIEGNSYHIIKNPIILEEAAKLDLQTTEYFEKHFKELYNPDRLLKLKSYFQAMYPNDIDIFADLLVEIDLVELSLLLRKPVMRRLPYWIRTESIKTSPKEWAVYILKRIFI